ncbi:hypothetical protein MMC12_006448 [Toensbergia leucococca]|nr:hypothetical protein [Toensbergia leucococca]
MRFTTLVVLFSGTALLHNVAAFPIRSDSLAETLEVSEPIFVRNSISLGDLTERDEPHHTGEHAHKHHDENHHHSAAAEEEWRQSHHKVEASKRAQTYCHPGEHCHHTYYHDGHKHGEYYHHHNATAEKEWKEAHPKAAQAAQAYKSSHHNATATHKHYSQKLKMRGEKQGTSESHAKDTSIEDTAYPGVTAGESTTFSHVSPAMSDNSESGEETGLHALAAAPMAGWGKSTKRDFELLDWEDAVRE